MQLTKTYTRKQIIDVLADFPLMQKRLADVKITQSLTSLRVYKNAKSICSYVSTQTEVNTHQVIRDALLAKGSIIVPKIQGSELELYSIRSFEELSVGTFGILEPHTRRAHVPIQSIDLFIVPGIAFGMDGSRLGRGKGYYDRLIINIHVPVIGLCYDRQLLDTVPYGAQDKKVDIIVTENHIYDFNITPFRHQNL